MSKKEKTENNEPLTNAVKRRMAFIERRQKNIDKRVAVLLKRKTRHDEGLKKINTELNALERKTAELKEKRRKELENIKELTALLKEA